MSNIKTASEQTLDTVIDVEARKKALRAMSNSAEQASAAFASLGKAIKIANEEMERTLQAHNSRQAWWKRDRQNKG